MRIRKFCWNGERTRTKTWKASKWQSGRSGVLLSKLSLLGIFQSNKKKPCSKAKDKKITLILPRITDTLATVWNQLNKNLKRSMNLSSQRITPTVFKSRIRSQLAGITPTTRTDWLNTETDTSKMSKALLMSSMEITMKFSIMTSNPSTMTSNLRSKDSNRSNSPKEETRIRETFWKRSTNSREDKEPINYTPTLTSDS